MPRCAKWNLLLLEAELRKKPFMDTSFSVVYLEPTEKEIELLGDKRDVELFGDQRAMKLLAEEEEEETNVKEAAFSFENEDDNEKEISE